MSAPHGGLWIFYFWRVIAHGLAFAFVGPAIGAIFSPGIVILPFALIMAYMASFVSAFVAGCCIAVATSFLRRISELYAAAAIIGAICGAIPIFLYGPQSWHVGLTMMYAFSGAIAAMACTYLFRHMRLHPDNPRLRVAR